jgi:hypothetical protein
MRQQHAQLLDEMNVADAVPDKKPVYPVVEIAVCEVRSQETLRAVGCRPPGGNVRYSALEHFGW